MATIGWLGTGLLGSGFVEAALSRGDRVKVWNRTAEKTAPLREKGALICDSPEQAVRDVERVHLCLSDDFAVEAVLGRILPELSSGIPIIDHTTVSPSGAVARAQMLAVRGVGFLACPVFMGPVNAQPGFGPHVVRRRIPPRTRARPSPARHDGRARASRRGCGPPVCAQAHRQLTHHWHVSLRGRCTDPRHRDRGFARRCTRVYRVVPVAGIVSGRAAKMSTGDHTASFELSMARKDVRLMLEATQGRELATLPGIAQRMDALIDRDLGNLDLGVLGVDAVVTTKGR
ncbi:MAG: NAD(P)-binding domain-containing protein [Polyangiaceae bacterium]